MMKILIHYISNLTKQNIAHLWIFFVDIVLGLDWTESNDNNDKI